MTRLGRLFLGDVFGQRQRRRNARLLLGYLAFVVSVVALDTVGFKVIMSLEGQRHSWATGIYWTLSTMSTLGLGDIVFVGDLGRLFTTFVLVSGILLLLVVLPFAFIRFFYAPWLETRRVPARVSGHVIITSVDEIALPLLEKLEVHGIPYFAIESDPARAAQLEAEGLAVVQGPVDDRATYERMRVAAARLVLANCGDTTNANVTLTVREAAPDVSIAAVADSDASIAILERAGATHVLPLKQRLGERLANRVNAGHAEAHVIGSFRNLLIAEFPVHNTPFVDRTIRDTGLRESLGVNVVGVLEQARLVAATPDTRLTEHSVPLVLGSREQISALDEFLVIYNPNYNPVLVVGGGKVGRAAVRVLKRKGVPVYLIDRKELEWEVADERPDRVIARDASDGGVLLEAGLSESPGVLLTTNDDATNIYLALHCRHLAPEVRIVSRITHDRNLAAIRSAGADIALSHTSLGVESVFAALRGHELVVLGGGVELHELPLPASLEGKSLGEAAIAARTGLNVVAIQEPGQLTPNPVASTILVEGSSLLTIGQQSQLAAFRKTYG